MYQEFLEHLELREGNVDHVYLDTLGKPTCGVGHLLSIEECGEYEIGQNVSQTTRDKWLEEDAQKAWDAAAQQIQDLAIEDPKFIVALGSVNFQLGTHWMDKFPSAYKALSSKDYDEAIRQVSTGSGKDGQSKWKEQTPVRVEDFVKAIKDLTNLTGAV
jgi:GH24 family phage-related lysozyme (muramidase)